MLVKRKKLLSYAVHLGLGLTEGRKHTKIADGNGNTMMVPRGSKAKELEGAWVKQFSRKFDVSEDDVWDRCR